MGAALRPRARGAGLRLAVMSSSGKGEALGRELGGLGFTGSNTDPALLERVVAATLDRYGRIDAVVNSAGHRRRARCWRSATPIGTRVWT